MNCLSSMVKYILFVFNLIFLCIGILLIVFGSIWIADLSHFQTDAYTETLPILVLVLGCIVFLVSFCGCCGAIKENICLMHVYAVCMFIIFALQVAMVVWVFVKREEVLDVMSDAIKSAYNSYVGQNDSAMDGLQVGFKCCGLQGAQDYTNNNLPVPKSCCGIMPGQTGVCTSTEYLSKPGCQPTFMDFWETNLDIIRWAGIAVALIELLAFTFACCLANNIRKSGMN